MAITRNSVQAAGGQANFDQAAEDRTTSVPLGNTCSDQVTSILKKFCNDSIVLEPEIGERSASRASGRSVRIQREERYN